jgi:hypothetical protein
MEAILLTIRQNVSYPCRFPTKEDNAILTRIEVIGSWLIIRFEAQSSHTRTIEPSSRPQGSRVGFRNPPFLGENIRW